MKQCRKCSVDLVVKENWYVSDSKKNSYRCIPCHKKNHYKYKITPKGKSAAKKANNSDKHYKLVQEYFNKGKVGVYGVFSDCKLIYIGQTTNSIKRKGCHFSTRTSLEDAKKQSSVSYALSIGELQRDKLRFKMLEFIDDITTRLAREKCLIDRYKPIYNNLYV